MNEKNTYTVKAGDTINYIAYRHNITIYELVKLNPKIEKDLLYLGQTLRVR